MAYTNDYIRKLENDTSELEITNKKLQEQINDLNVQIGQKKMNIKFFKKNYPSNNYGTTAAENQLKSLGKQLNLKMYGYRLNNKTIGDKQRQIATEIQNHENQQKELAKEMTDEQKGKEEETKAETKYAKHFRKAKGHAGKLHGHMGSRNIGLFFILLFISTVIIDWYGRSGETFGVIATPFFSIPIIYLVQLIFIFWFYIDTDNVIDTVLLSLIFILNIYGAIPLIGIDLPYIFPLVILALFRFFLLKETPIQFNSIKVVVIILIVLAILFALLSAVSASIVSYADEMPSSSGSSTSDTGSSTSSTDSSAGSGDGLLCTLFSISCDSSSESTSDDGYPDSDTSDSSSSSSTTSSSSPSAYTSLICFFYPPYCSTPADTTDDGGDAPTPVSDGTVNEVKPALARPTMTVSESSMPSRILHLAWKVKNIGEEPVDTALFLMNGSEIHGNYSGKISLLDNFNSYTYKIDYPGVSISDELFFKQIPYIAGGMDQTARITVNVPKCSLGRFEAPVFILYKHTLDSSLTLTLADYMWWDKLEQQDRISKLMPRKSTSTSGQLSLSIYPDDNNQPVLIGKGEPFGMNFELSNKDNGRAAINKFEIYISDKLEPEDLGGDTCDLVELSNPSDTITLLKAYTLKSVYIDEINSADLSFDNGFTSGKKEYYCSFKYSDASFDDDFKAGSTHRFIKANLEYTYVYNGLFTLSTQNMTGVDLC